MDSGPAKPGVATGQKSAFSVVYASTKQFWPLKFRKKEKRKKTFIGIVGNSRGLLDVAGLYTHLIERVTRVSENLQIIFEKVRH